MSRRKPASKAPSRVDFARACAAAIERLKTAPDLDLLHYELAIAAAKGGDHKAGIEVLRLCAEALDVGRRSIELSTYLRSAISEIEAGLQKSTTAEQIAALAATALNLRPKRKPGRPKNADSGWQEPLCAVAAIFTLRGYRPEEIIGILEEARLALENKPLARTEAQDIRKAAKPLLKSTSQRYYDDEKKLRALTPAEHEEDLMRAALLVDGLPRRNAQALQVLLSKYLRMR